MSQLEASHLALVSSRDVSQAMSELIRGRRGEVALELFTLVQHAEHFSAKDKMFLYSSAINACAKTKQPQRAVDLLSEMSRLGLQPNAVAYNAAISACEKVSKWEVALKLLDKMRDRGVQANTISYSAAISACEKAGKWEVRSEERRVGKDA